MQNMPTGEWLPQINLSKHNMLVNVDYLKKKILTEIDFSLISGDWLGLTVDSSSELLYYPIFKVSISLSRFISLWWILNVLPPTSDNSINSQS